jgi:ribose 1,5-bisphosphate isomerase
MDERSVVTVFLTNAGRTLLLRRSEAVDTYPGRWAAVSGHVEETPEATARREIREETGLDDDRLTLWRRGDPFEVADEELGLRFTVHPFRFETPTREVDPNWESDDLAWVHPTEIRELDTVPDLWGSWDAVRPTLDSVAADEEHGAATISIEALSVLRDEAAMLADRGANWEAVADVAERFRAARASMAVLRVRIDRTMSAASETGTPAAVHDAAIEEIDRAAGADRAASAAATELVANRRVFTLSRSGTVERALVDGDPAWVGVAESRPGGEGRDLATAVAESGTPVRLYGDLNVPAGVAEADVVLVGADTILANGDVINKTGTLSVALAADWADVPVVVVAATDKISPRSDWRSDTEDTDPDSLAVEDADPEQDVPTAAPIFERVPAELIDRYRTEDGSLDAAAVRSVADRHAELAGWMANR